MQGQSKHAEYRMSLRWATPKERALCPDAEYVMVVNDDDASGQLSQDEAELVVHCWQRGRS